MSKLRVAMLGLVVIGVLAVAAPTFAKHDKAAATVITVNAGKPTPFSFVLSKKTAKKGAVTFVVKNVGVGLPHDFKINGKKTPNIQPGKSATLKVTFAKAGKYPYLCTVPGHARGGMKGTFVVT